MLDPQVEIVADIPIKIRILKRAGYYGYELTIMRGVKTGWSTARGEALEIPTHAWRTAFNRAKECGLRELGLPY